MFTEKAPASLQHGLLGLALIACVGLNVFQAVELTELRKAVSGLQKSSEEAWRFSYDVYTHSHESRARAEQARQQLDATLACATDGC